MSTAAQIQANQLNAQLSTGPRTLEGKSQVSKNALVRRSSKSEGGTYPVIRTLEEQTQFDDLESEFKNEIRPQTPTELTLFKQLILAAWNVDRCHRLESDLSATTEIDPLLDEVASKTLSRIEIYRSRAGRAFHRNLKLLKAPKNPTSQPPGISDRPEYRKSAEGITNKPNPEPRIKFINPRTTPKVGRNEPCPCKSGKKYKFCCLNCGANGQMQADPFK